MKYHNSQSGFSLVETLVAITILLIVIVGPLTIVSTTSTSTNFSNEQVIAFYLAQEGAELAQKARDDLVLAWFEGTHANPWGDFTSNIGAGDTADYDDCFASGCGLEITSDAIGSLEPTVDCAPAGACDLYYEISAGNFRSRYTYDSTGGNTETIYSRVVTFQNISASEVRVVSTVEWFSGLSLDRQSVSVVTYLFDVYGN